MTFVPFVSPPPPSVKAAELGNRLMATIESFRQSHPAVTSAEVRQAMHLALAKAETGKPVLATLLALGLGVLCLLFGVLVFFYRAGGEIPAEGSSPILVALIGFGVIALAAVAVIKNR